MSTDKDWEKWGSDNPYFGVLSHPKFLGTKLKPTTEQEFYQAGKSDIDRVMNRINLLGGSKFKCSVDFGCGTGRLTIPLTSHSAKVVGLDVSPSILDEAKKKTPKDLTTKISYRVSDDRLDNLPQKYDLAHSYIVLQHIPPKRGERIIRKLLTELQPSGFAALHVTFAHDAPAFHKFVIWLRNHIVPIHYLLNVIKGRRWNTPRMRMHLYSLDRITNIFDSCGLSDTLQLSTDHGGYLGAMIIGKKH